MAEHTSSQQTSPTVSTPDFPELDDLFREEWNRRNKHLEAAKEPEGRRGSNEDPPRGRFGSSSSAKRRSFDLDSPEQSSSSAKRRSIDQSSPTQSSSSSSITNIRVTNQDQRRNSSSSSTMDKTEPSSNSGGKGEGNSTSNSHSSIPPLNNNVAVAIFVPITNGQALLSPPAVIPETPPYFLEKLERLSVHEAAVRGNIEALYGLEYLRVRAHVATAYPDDSSFDYFGATAAVRSLQDGALRQDLDIMLDNMRRSDATIANPNLAANVKKDVVLPSMDLADITYHPLNSPREAAASDVLKLLGDAATELGSFDNHVQVITDAIKSEMQGAAARGMREKQDRMDTD
ncbi:hypothetical protein V8C26DRAFT_426099 [Trichoderma gracile]